MPKIDEATRQKLSADHPGVRFIPIEADRESDAPADEVVHEFAFRKGTRTDWKRYQEQLRDGAMGRSNGSVGIEATLYAQGRLVHPPVGARAAWDELREDAPDVLQDIGHELLKEHSKGLKVSLGKP
jgi:hypothetical protein